MKTKKINPVLKKLALARINVLSDNIKIHLGSPGQSFSRDDLVHHISAETKIGQQIVDIQISFLRDLASGKIYQDD